MPDLFRRLHHRYGSPDVVSIVELDRPVYDINVEGTHNFVAEGLVNERKTNPLSANFG